MDPKGSIKFDGKQEKFINFLVKSVFICYTDFVADKGSIQLKILMDLGTDFPLFLPIDKA